MRCLGLKVVQTVLLIVRWPQSSRGWTPTMTQFAMPPLLRSFT